MTHRDTKARRRYQCIKQGVSGPPQIPHHCGGPPPRPHRTSRGRARRRAYHRVAHTAPWLARGPTALTRPLGAVLWTSLWVRAARPRQTGRTGHCAARRRLVKRVPRARVAGSGCAASYVCSRPPPLGAGDVGGSRQLLAASGRAMTPLAPGFCFFCLGHASVLQAASTAPSRTGVRATSILKRVP